MPVAAQVIPMRDSGDVAAREMMRELQPYLDKTDICNRIFGPDVLLAIYDRAGQVTAGGILIPGTNREDQFQGKVGLVLALGKRCYGDHFDDWFGEYPPKVGDWMAANTREGTTILIGKFVCRVVEYQYLRFGTAVPDLTM